MPARVSKFPVLAFLLGIALLSVGCGAGQYRVGGGNSAQAALAARAPEKAKEPQPDRDADGIPDSKDVATDEREDGDGKKLAQAPAKAPATATDAHDVSFLIYTAELTMAVFQVDQGLAAVEKVGRDVGGYLSVKADAKVTIRVPRERFDEAIHRIEGLGDVLHRNVTAEDVTDEYVDLEIRLKNAHAMRERLQALLKNAAVKDALEIEKELGRVTGEIEQMEGRMKLLKDKIAYSTITVEFQPRSAETVETQANLPFPWLQELGLSSLLSVHQ